jgi:hypothetical protein
MKRGGGGVKKEETEKEFMGFVKFTWKEDNKSFMVIKSEWKGNKRI